MLTLVADWSTTITADIGNSLFTQYHFQECSIETAMQFNTSNSGEQISVEKQLYGNYCI